MSYKVLFLGFSDIQLELAKKFITLRRLGEHIDVRSERAAFGAPDGYVINGDDEHAIGRLALHLRTHPRPTLAVGLQAAPGATAYAAGPFKPASADRLMELLRGTPNDGTAADFGGLATPPRGTVVNFPRAAAPSAYTEVLVVDDSELVRRTMVRKISEWGHAVETAANGEEAMALLLEGRYRVIFLDVMMPGMDGLELCRRIKKSTDFKGTAVYLLTSKSGMFDKVRGTMAGCDGYLTKPLEARRLRAVLDQHFERSSTVQDTNMAMAQALNEAEREALEGPASPRERELDRPSFATTVQESRRSSRQDTAASSVGGPTFAPTIPGFTNTFAPTVPGFGETVPNPRALDDLERKR